MLLVRFVCVEIQKQIKPAPMTDGGENHFVAWTGFVRVEVVGWWTDDQ